MPRQYDSIDVVKLYSTWDEQKWLSLMAACEANNDIEKLRKIAYGLQTGMTDASKKKLNSEKLIKWFLWAQRCVEKSMKNIQRKLNPNPFDNPNNAGKYDKKLLDEKRKRDRELEDILRKWRF